MEKLSIFLVIVMMTSLAYSADLTCNIDPTSGACMIVNITEISQHNEAITVVGQSSNYINSATSLISFMDSFVIRYIPTKIFSIFPNIENFVLYNNSLTYIVTDAFANCPLLKMIYMANLNVKHLSTGFAQTCTNLETVSMTDGLIETIDADAFKGLGKVQNLMLRNNKIACIPATLFQPMPLINTINLDSNMITGLDSITFKGLKILSNFDMRLNQLTSMPLLDITDTGLAMGLSLGFHYNPITAISPSSISMLATRPSNVSTHLYISGLPCIQDQSISAVTTQNYQTIGPTLQTCYNNWQPSMATPPTCSQSTTTTTTMPPTSLATTTAPPISGTCPSDKICRYFLDQYNRYTCILDGVDSLLTSIGGTHLITFDDLTVRRVVFTNSFLSRIPPILFQKFPNLEYLTASNCSMSSINTKTFGTTCGNLKFFDASYNDVTSVDGASFKSCTKIEVVDLTGNQFSSIDGQLFVNNPTLKSIYINRPASMVLL